ncbi:MAG: hypothetical protein U1E65_34930 [Myxococcota bacterium]
MSIQFPGQLRGVTGASYEGVDQTQDVGSKRKRVDADGFERGGKKSGGVPGWTWAGIGMNCLAGLAFGVLHANGLGIVMTALAGMCFVASTLK